MMTEPDLGQVPELELSVIAAPAEPEPDSSLAGRRIIITRAARQAGELMRQLSSHGGEIIPCPTIEIRDPSDWRSLDRALGRLAEYHWLAFTSTNGVEYFLRRMDELERDRAELSALRICAVGKKTAEKLIDEGLRIDLMPTRFTADSLVEAFIKRYGVDHDLKGSRMLLPASRTTRDVIRPALTDLGVSVDVVEAYQTVLPEKSGEIIAMLTSRPADYIIFTSPSTVANLATLLETDNLSKWFPQTRVACIGPVTAESAQVHGLQVHVQPEEHTSKGLVKALIEDSRK
ncbi:MAG TPA: uroporphyrinogen-III synthase [Blastocatellia bacterium]|nr:uroporphyrinogen-III synthase [Blastocatellia bacterium]